MKNTLIFLCILLLTGLSGLTLFSIIQIIGNTGSRPVYGSLLSAPGALPHPQIDPPSGDMQEVPEEIVQGDYEIYVDGKLSGCFETYEEAVSFGENHERALLRQKGKVKLLWDNYPPYNVFTDTNVYTEFKTFVEAVTYAKRQPKAYIYYRKNNALIWTNVEERKASAQVDGVPWIGQLPELPRGCEVTSLAMLLNYKGVSVSKTVLADEVKKNPAPFGTGSPYRGFVGDMRNMNKNGLGVYHGPIHTLLSAYLPDSALDLTGADFEDLLYFINQDMPIWVINNTTYQKLPASYFETWRTEDGDLKITYKEHSVLIIGYDEQYIYFNDPLSKGSNRALRRNFIEAWIQMGSQAITITP